jgi:hypothetical protein
VARDKQKCQRCGKTRTTDTSCLRLSEFSRDANGKFSPTCKLCKNARRRELRILPEAPWEATYMEEELGDAVEYTKRPVNANSVFLRYCPNGSWPVDRYFNGMEFHAMLEDGYLQAGMLVEIAEIEYIILGKQLESQWMIPL